MKNNLYRKGFIVQVLLGVIVILMISGGFYLYKNKKVEVPVAENKKIDLDNQKEIAPIDTTTKNTNIKTFKLGDLEFSYPDILNFSKNGEVVSLGHSIPLKHVNSCDLEDGSTINDLADFGASFKIFDKNLKDSVLGNESDYFSKNYIKNDTFILSDGFVEKFSIGNLNGFKISMGLEGCGVDNYYFPISSTKTLFISKNWYAESYQIDEITRNKLNGIILRTQEDEIFKDILSSVSGFENYKTMNIKVYFRKSPLVCSEKNINIISFNRVIPQTKSVARASIEELLKGPTQEEKNKGYWSDIPDGVSVKSINLINGEVKVDFSEKIGSGLDTCNDGKTRVAQIRQTLLQFPTIKTVKILINGDPQP